MKIICLTGGIASGKSTAARLLENLGARIIDADKLGHRSYKKGTVAYEKLIKAFGEKIIEASSEEIDRKILGTIVFNEEKLLKKLTDIVWPAIRVLAEKVIKDIKTAKKTTEKL